MFVKWVTRDNWVLPPRLNAATNAAGMLAEWFTHEKIYTQQSHTYSWPHTEISCVVDIRNCELRAMYYNTNILHLKIMQIFVEIETSCVSVEHSANAPPRSSKLHWINCYCRGPALSINFGCTLCELLRIYQISAARVLQIAFQVCVCIFDIRVMYFRSYFWKIDTSNEQLWNWKMKDSRCSINALLN